MSIDRSIAPEIKSVSKIDLPNPDCIDKKWSFFWAKDQQLESVKVELLFEAGSKMQTEKLQAKMCAELILSGTKTKSAYEIASAMDLLGGFFRVEPSKDFLSIQFYGMQSRIDDIVAIGLDAIMNAVFPENEWKEQINISRSGYIQASEKVSVLARRKFYHKIYSDTPYDTGAELDDYDKIKLEQIAEFHLKNIKNNAPAIFVSGAYNQNLEKRLLSFVKTFEKPFIQPDFVIGVPKNKPFEVINIEKEGVLQNALRMGKKMWNYNHEDRISFTVLNTILGGYFGSRLMMNIREDKGFTYGIGSYYISHQDFGIWGIATEIGSQYAEDTFKEIEKEINLMRDEKVGEEELNRVKSYMVGQFLQNTDGTFAVMEQFKSLWLRHDSFDKLNIWLSTVQSITADEVQKLAQQYLNIEHMTVVNAGQIATFR